MTTTSANSFKRWAQRHHMWFGAQSNSAPRPGARPEAPAADTFELPSAPDAQASRPGPSAERERFIAELYELLQDPISLEILAHPVVTSAGHTYERSSIARALEQRLEDPQTREPVTRELVDNRLVRSIVERFAADFEPLATGPTPAPRPAPPVPPWLESLRREREPLGLALKAALRSVARDVGRACSAVEAQAQRRPRVATGLVALTYASFAASAGLGVGLGLGTTAGDARRLLGLGLEIAPAALPALSCRALPVGLAPAVAVGVGALLGHCDRPVQWWEILDQAMFTLHGANLVAGAGRALAGGTWALLGATVLANGSAYLVDLLMAVVLNKAAPLGPQPRPMELGRMAACFAGMGVLVGLSRLAG